MNLDLKDYLELLDWTERQHCTDKSGKIPAGLEPILKRIDIEIETWLITVKQYDKGFVISALQAGENQRFHFDLV